MSRRVIIALVALFAASCQLETGAPPTDGASDVASPSLDAETGDVGSRDGGDEDTSRDDVSRDDVSRDAGSDAPVERDVSDADPGTDTTDDDAEIGDVSADTAGDSSGDIDAGSDAGAGDVDFDADADVHDADADDVDAGDDAHTDTDDVDVDDDTVADTDTGDDTDTDVEEDVDADTDVDDADADDVDAGDDADTDADDDVDVDDDTVADTDTSDDTDTDDEEDVDAVADTDTDADTGGPSDDDPLPEHGPVPHDVYVHVVDDRGEPVAGARVALDGRGSQADKNGDAGFHRLPPGEYRLLVTAPGSPSGFWDIEIPHLYPEEIEIPHLHEKRYVVGLPTYRATGPFAATAGVTRDVDGHRVTVSPDSLIDLDGDPYRGTVQLSGVNLSAAGPDSQFAASLRAAEESGLEVLIDPISAFDLRLTEDATGLPLQPAPGSPILVSFPAPSGALPGDSISAWVIDPLSGKWQEEDGVSGTVNDDGLVEIEIPHLSRWAFGPSVPVASACVRVAVPGVEEYADVSLQLTSAGISRRMPLTDSVLDLFDVPVRGDVDVAVYVGGDRIASRRVAVVANSDGDLATCAEMSTPAELLLPAPFSVGAGPGRVRALARASICPAGRVDVELLGPGGASFRAPMTSSTVLAEGLVPGGWTARFIEPIGGALLGQQSFTVTDCGLGVCPPEELTVNLGADAAAYVEGGCGGVVCAGNSCGSCVEIVAVDDASDPVAGMDVSLHAPAYTSIETDVDGFACVDVFDGARSEIVVTAAGVSPSGALLPAGASCATGGCVRLPLVQGAPLLSCAAGERRIDGVARAAGFEDPGFTTRNEYLLSDVPSRLSLRIGVGALGLLSTVIGVDGLDLVAQSAGFRQREQTITGHQYDGDLHMKTLVAALIGLDIVVRGVDVDASGDLDLSVSPVELRVLDLSLGVLTPWVSTEGEGQVVGQDDGSVLVRLIGVFVDLGLLSVEVEGYVIANVETRADTDEHLAELDTYDLNGAVASVASSLAPSGRPVAIAGHIGDDASASGELRMCAPDDGPFMLTGETVSGQLRPFTALYEFGTLGALGLAGNSALGASAFVDTDLRWFDRSFIERLYDAVSVDPLRAHERGTIFGVAPTGLLSLGDPGEVWLEHPDHGRIDAIRLDGEFRVSSSGRYFAFVDLQPAPIDRPYTLRMESSLLIIPVEVTAFRQQFAPIAGGVAYIE